MHMDIKDILSVGLTAEDFDTLIEGLDAIPEKGIAGELMSSLLLGLLVPDNERLKKEHAQRVEAKAKDMAKKMEGRKEDFIVLKSKLILLKRLLSGNEAIHMAKEVLKSPPPPFN